MPTTQPAATGTGSSGSGIPVAVAGGTVDAITATFVPAITLADKTLCAIRASGANTLTNPTFNPNGLGALTIVKRGGAALVAGDIPAALAIAFLQYDLANTRWELVTYADAAALAAAVQSGALTDGVTKAPTHDAVFDLQHQGLTGHSARWKWDATANTTPAAGYMAGNHVTWASATVLYFNKTDADGVDQSTQLFAWALQSQSFEWPLIKVSKEIGGTTSFRFWEGDTFALVGSVYNLTGGPITAVGTFSAEDYVVVYLARMIVLQNPPTENDTRAAPTSEWAFDHNAGDAAAALAAVKASFAAAGGVLVGTGAGTAAERNLTYIYAHGNCGADETFLLASYANHSATIDQAATTLNITDPGDGVKSFLYLTPSAASTLTWQKTGGGGTFTWINGAALTTVANGNKVIVQIVRIAADDYWLGYLPVGWTE
jgi:hypothetical protein